MRIASTGHAVFAATMIALGILGLIKGDFTPIWTGVPESLPAREMLAYLCALISLGSGIGLLWRRTAVGASGVLLIYLLIWMLLFRVAHAVAAPTVVVNWWPCGESAVMVAAAWVLYASFARDQEGERFRFATGDRGVRVARVFYGLGLIPLGVAHFAYLKETVVLVPAWLPWPAADWAYFTGGALVAAGVAMIIGVFARLAATLSALEMGLFTLLVWVPIVAGTPNAFQWSEFVDSCTLTAAAWVIAESYRGTRWLAVGRSSAAALRDSSTLRRSAA
jgi:uncharacterized membrane protein